MEAAVFGARAGAAARDSIAATSGTLHRTLLSPLPDAALQDLRIAMSRDAGVIRDAEGLSRLLATITRMDVAHGVCGPLVAARLVASCALERRESRGGHFRADYPVALPAARTFITLKNGALAALAA